MAPLSRVARPLRAMPWRLVATVLLAVALVPAFAPSPVSAQAAGGTGVHYEIYLRCPPAQDFSFSGAAAVPGCPVRAVDGQDEMGDPSIAVDPMDPSNLIIASLHGQTWAGAGNGNADFFVSAASCPEKGPTPKSRCGQTFTTFTSRDAGGSWFDNPFVPPDEVGQRAFGETTAITIDPYGHVFVGSLYANPVGEGGSGFRYQVVAQKFSDLGNINSNQDGAYHAEYLDPQFKDNAIRDLWFLFDPRQDNMTMVWSEHLAKVKLPPPCNTDGNATAAGNFYARPDGSLWQETNNRPGLQTDATCPTDPDQRVAAAPANAGPSQPAQPARAASPGAARVPVGLRGVTAGSYALGQDAMGNATSGAPGNGTAPPGSGMANATALLQAETPHSVIGVLWTGIELNDTYHYQPREQAIGPCSSSTNPVLSDGYLYVGCIAAPEEGPFVWHPETQTGTVELFRMDPSGGKPVYLGPSPILAQNGATPRLGVRSDGRLALVQAGASDDGQLQLQVAFGHYRTYTKGYERDNREGYISWSSMTSYGDKLQPKDPAVHVTGAGVQDLIYREYSGVIHFVLKTKTQRTAVSASAPDPPLAPHIHKQLIALDEKFGIVYRHDLDIGTLLNRSSDPDLLQAPEAAYDDIKDDFLQLPETDNFTWTDGAGKTHDMGAHYQREFFAVADYGQVLFAELIEDTNLRGPGAGQAPGDPTPLAAPTGSTNLSAALVGTTMTAGSAAVALSMFLNRRKDPLAAITKGGK